MISQVINKYNELYQFTSNPLCLVIKKEVNEVNYPFKLVNGDYKQLIDFQKLKDFDYWYITGEVLVEVENRYSLKNMYNATYPLRIFVCKKDVEAEDLVLNFMKKIDSLTLSVKRNLGLTNVQYNIRSYQLNREQVLEGEFATIPKLPLKYGVATIDIDITLMLDANCIDVC